MMARTDQYSKSQIDKAGLVLSRDSYTSEEELVGAEEAFDHYRSLHLKPLTEMTLEIQDYLGEYSDKYYIAQRLKRKPQILRKLLRFRSRLTQLQDIGGARIIVEKNDDVDELHKLLRSRIETNSSIKILKETDYREAGRDDSGYRALHLIIKSDGINLELQIRSKIQHYWAESIERTSVIYGHYLKELEGSPTVIAYFKNLSNIFYELECARQPSPRQKVELEKLRVEATEIIKGTSDINLLESHINEGIIQTLVAKQSKGKSPFNNWILIFDWRNGSFVNWEIVDRDPVAATKAYSGAERRFRTQEGFEVVMIGSSDIATVRETHSHYFGIESNSAILDSLDASIIGFSKKMDLDVGARQILLSLHNRRAWGKRSIAENTLKNHFCRGVITFDSSFASLLSKELIVRTNGGAILLNMKKKRDIEEYLEK